MVVQRRQRNQRNPPNPLKNCGKLMNNNHNSCRNHQGSCTISQNHFLIHFATKSNTNPKGRPPCPGPLIQLLAPSDRIAHAGPIKISRSDSPPNLRLEMIQHDSWMYPGWIKNLQRNVQKSPNFFSNMAFDYPRSSPKSLRRLPTITKK